MSADGASEFAGDERQPAPLSSRLAAAKATAGVLETRMSNLPTKPCELMLEHDDLELLD